MNVVRICCQSKGGWCSDKVQGRWVKSRKCKEKKRKKRKSRKKGGLDILKPKKGPAGFEKQHHHHHHKVWGNE
jgi:hypothetical protein